MEKQFQPKKPKILEMEYVTAYRFHKVPTIFRDFRAFRAFRDFRAIFVVVFVICEFTFFTAFSCPISRFPCPIARFFTLLIFAGFVEIIRNANCHEIRMIFMAEQPGI